MQSLYKEHACLVAAGIDGAIEAGNCDKGLTGKFIRHDCLLSFLHFMAWRLAAFGDSADKARAPCRGACSALDRNFIAAGRAPVDVEHNDGAPDDVSGTKQFEVFVDVLEVDSLDGMLNLAFLCKRQHFLQIAVVRPERAVISEFAGGKREQRNIDRSEEHTSELQSLRHLVCRLLLEK